MKHTCIKSPTRLQRAQFVLATHLGALLRDMLCMPILVPLGKTLERAEARVWLFQARFRGDLCDACKAERSAWSRAN